MIRKPKLMLFLLAYILALIAIIYPLIKVAPYLQIRR